MEKEVTVQDEIAVWIASKDAKQLYDQDYFTPFEKTVMIIAMRRSFLEGYFKGISNGTNTEKSAVDSE